MDLDPTPVPVPVPDPEATLGGGFPLDELGAANGKRQILSKAEMIARLTALVRSCEGCDNVTVLDVDKLDRADRCDGCNWSLSIVLDPAGVAPEVYSLAYGSALAIARPNWNLE